MFVYIDAMFNTRYGINSPTNSVGEHLTVDSPGVKNIPPHLLIPEFVTLATSDGEAHELDGTDLWKLFTDLNTLMSRFYTSSNAQFVGWYLDQTLFPCLCANAMTLGCRLPSQLFRKLDDKWSKTGGLSLERAFYQGWYPEDKEAVSAPKLTLEEAVSMCGLPTLSKLEEDLAAKVSGRNFKLLARISAISSLHSRYDNISKWRP